MRRQQQEQRSLAIQVINAYAEAMNAGTEASKTSPPRTNGDKKSIPPELLFGDMGAKVKVARGK